jgi:hypothetical protein
VVGSGGIILLLEEGASSDRPFALNGLQPGSGDLAWSVALPISASTPPLLPMAVDATPSGGVYIAAGASLFAVRDGVLRWISPPAQAPLTLAPILAPSAGLVITGTCG